MQDMLRRAVVSIQAGEREEGKHLLTLVVQVEPDNATAWLWLAAVADNEAERLNALQRVIQINPDSTIGRRAQALLRQDVIREVGSRIPPPPPARALGPSPPSPPVHPAERHRSADRHTLPATVPPAERPRPRRGWIGLLLFGVVAACIGAGAASAFTLYSREQAPRNPTPTRIVVERTRAPATPRPPTQPPPAPATQQAPPQPSVTPNARYGACGRDPVLAAQPIFLCLDSEPGDPVGGGRQQHITPADGPFTVAWNLDGAVEAQIQGADRWDLVFQVPYGLQLRPGGSFEWRTFDRPVPTTELGLTITGGSAACTQATGRVSILGLEYQGDQITRFAADFEQHCMGDPPGLYGTILFQAGP